MGSRCNDVIKFFVNDIPFGIDNSLIIFGFLNSDFSVFFFAFEFEFEIQKEDFGVIEGFGLLFKTGIGEGFFKSNSVNNKGIGNRSSSNTFNSDHLFIKKLRV